MFDNASADRAMRPPPWWQRLHARLMPDYNTKATAYWWTMVCLGGATFAGSAVQVAALSWADLLQLAAGILLALLMALFPLKIPRTDQAFSLGDVFIVLLLLMHGAAAGCVAAALEGLVSSWRSSKRWTTRLGTAAIAAVTMRACGELLHAATMRLGSGAADHAAALVMCAMAFGMVYAVGNVVLMSTVARLKRGDPVCLWTAFSVFGWVGAASAVASALAALLFITQHLAGMGVMLTVLPVVGLMLTTLHFFSRQQGADESARQAATRSLKNEADLAISLVRQREAEQAAQHLRELESSEMRFQSAFTHASIGMALVAQDGRVHQANPALCALLGYTDTAIEGRSLNDHAGVTDRLRLDVTLARVSAGVGEVLPLQICCQRLDGSEVWVSISCSLFSNVPSEGPTVIMQIQDVTARHRAELELHHRAFHDKLTGLANRERFHEVLGSAIERANGEAGPAFAVLFLDFDRFKLINDSKGHSVGDEFLVKVSKRLQRCLRKVDLLARLGGDEFAILAVGLQSEAEALDLAKRLLATLREPVRLGSLEISASASIGITFSSMGYARPEDVLRDADIAMYRAKFEGKGRYALFDAHLHTEVASRVRLESDLRQTLNQQALAVAYQPLYGLKTGALMGFEALSRWTHDELGPISPATFIPIAEESGLITQLTTFVLQDACRHLRQWMSDHLGCDDLSVHVNIAARDLADSQFLSRVQHALSSSGLAPHHLVIELTENILMVQLAAAMTTLKALRELGVGLSVDDFGTGYSSLSHLAVLPIDSLKIDMSFVRNLRAGTNEEAVIRAIVLLASSLGKHAIAEGIETQAQLDLLRDMGCDFGQGFFLSRPLLPAAVASLLQARSAAAAAPAGRGALAAPAQPLRTALEH